MANRASAALTYAVSQHDDVARLRSLCAIRLNVVAEAFCTGCATFAILVSDRKCPDEVTFPECQHRCENISTASYRMSTCVLFLFRLLAACFCPTRLCHRILYFTLGNPWIVQRCGHPFVDQIEHNLSFGV